MTITTKNVGVVEFPVPVATTAVTTTAKADAKESIAADSGHSSTPLPPSVSVRQSKSTGVLNAQIAAAKSPYDGQLAALRKQCDELINAKYSDSWKMGELAGEYVALIKKAGDSDPIAAEARTDIKRLAFRLIDESVGYLDKTKNELTQPNQARRLADSTRVAYALVNGGGKAEYDQISDAIEFVAAGTDEIAAIMREALVMGRRRIVETEESAWQLAGLAPSSLDLAHRIDTRLNARMPTPENVDGIIDDITRAVADGDGRFADDLINSARAGIPDLFKVNIARIFDKKVDPEQTYAKEFPDAAFTYNEAKALSDLINTLRGTAVATRRMQDLQMRELSSTQSMDYADYEIEQLGYLIAAVKKDTEPNAEYLASLETARDRMLVSSNAQSQALIDDAIAAIDKAGSIINIDAKVFDVASRASTKLAGRGVTGASAFKDACVNGLEASKDAWDKRVAELKAGPYAAAIEATGNELYTKKSTFDRQASIADIDYKSGMRAAIELDWVEVVVDAVERQPASERNTSDLSGCKFECKSVAKNTDDPEMKVRARQLQARVAALGG